MEEWACKIVLVGDSRVGKSSLIHRFISDTYLELYTPTGFEKYTFTYEMSESRINFTIWDTSGALAYDTVRPLAYQDAKVFLLCFQIGDPDTLDNTVNKWFPEVKGSGAPLILCGCQSDLRSDAETLGHLAKFQRTPVTSEQALSISRHIGAITYVESSAKASLRSVREAFEVAALAAFGRLNKNHFLPGAATLHRHRSFLKLKNKQDLKHELRGKSRNCAIM